MGEDREVSADVIQKILTEYKTWAVVGCSADPGRYSNVVARFLEDHGYDVIPVNHRIGGARADVLPRPRVDPERDRG